MLGDEERKAIETLTNKRPSEQILISGKMCVNVLINLINKQSKEIEELKDESKEYQIGFAQGCYERDLDWKDKIKAKIEEYDKTLYYAETEEGMAEIKDYEYDEAKYGKKALQSLLEKE